MRDVEKRRASQREYYKKNRDKKIASTQRYYLNNKETVLKRSAEWARQNRPSKNIANRRWHLKVKMEVLNHYGGTPPKCACCGEALIEFLSIDHINGGGNKERKMTGPTYDFLRRENFPLGYRVLCMNCNFAIGHFGYCPHQIKEGLDVSV